LGFAAEIHVLTAAEDARRKLEHDLAYKTVAVPFAPTLGESHIATLDSAIGELEDVIREFQTLIERPDVHEKRDVHPFLEKNNFILVANPDTVTSEVPIIS
jgi:ppGpp synthetase/RelA/SpoT-type nucleotidyltranferase